METDGNYFLIRDNARIRLSTQRVFESWSLQAIPVELSAVKHLPISGKMGFRDGSLICNYADGKIYLVSGNKRRPITNPDVYERYGLNEGDTIFVSQDEINLQKEGEPLG